MVNALWSWSCLSLGHNSLKGISKTRPAGPGAVDYNGYFVPCYSISPIMSECPPTHPKVSFFFFYFFAQLMQVALSCQFSSFFFFSLVFFLSLSCLGLVMGLSCSRFSWSQECMWRNFLVLVKVVLTTISYVTSWRWCASGLGSGISLQAWKCFPFSCLFFPSPLNWWVAFHFSAHQLVTTSD